MYTPTGEHRKFQVLYKAALAIFSLFIVIIPLHDALAQSGTGETQRLSGRIIPGGVVFYDLPARQRGETLYVSMYAASDNLDPFVGLLSAEIDLDTVRADFNRDMSAAGLSTNPVEAINAVRDQYFLAWDDDSGPEYAAALTYKIPEDSDYYLVVSSSATTIWQAVFGDYELLVGIDEPTVLSGEAEDNALIAIRNDALSPVNVGVQNFTAELLESKPASILRLVDVKAGDTLSLLAESLSDELNLGLVLLDFGGKPIAMVVSEGKEDSALLEYTFPEDDDGYSLRVFGCCGEYQLSAGLNAPEVLSGQTEERGAPVLETAIPINTGLRLQQITDVDQKAENFSVVATLKMEWYDPRLAFSQEECRCLNKTYSQRNINSLLEEVGDSWPDFTFFNQQGNRWIQNQVVVILPDGHVTYLERFTTTFQAADFDFRQVPFDTQQFFIEIDGLWSEDLYYFQDNEDFTAVGTQLGEDEWPITDFDVTVSSEESSTEILTSRYSFNFEARRNVSFYVLRIFVPILVVILVSWITFFLKDYNNRVDVAAGNLLLFIAFNFTISDDLPRLGYLTFMDMVLISSFLITALVVVFNVVLKRLEIAGRHELAARLDTPMIWLYPLLYVVIIAINYYHFFIQSI